MSAEQTAPTLDPAHALRPSLLTPARQRQPIFWLALLAAAVVHAMLVVGLSRSQPRRLGDAKGSERAINVELVDEGELRAMGAQQRPAPPPATPPGAQKSSPAPEQPQAEPQPKSKAEKEPVPETAPPQQAAALPAFDTQELKATPPPEAQLKTPKKSTKSESEPQKKPQKKEEPAKPKAQAALKPPTKLDLSVPFDMRMQGAAGGAGASSATRPAGITRSGANDRFGRDVIRALKKTMPPSEGVTGKVKVRIFLNERGNVAWVRVINGSGDRLLDDSVVFSVRQALFPFPPKGATEADRTFLVTYIYR
jgi:protein TonB